MNNLCRHVAIALALSTSSNFAFSQSKKEVPKSPASSPNCFVSEFKHITLSVHEPIARAKQAQLWLVQNVSACSVEKLSFINANRSAWLGTSDSTMITMTLESMIEYKASDKPEMLAQIFSSIVKEGTSSVQVMSVTQAPRTQQAQPAYDTQLQQQQAYTQAQQQPANPQAAYPQATQGGR